ncbi:MAG: ATP cone domain-containing protein [Patescibacteria group bacterium]|nr:ATP cone domain-containing protein [Patescibacteria group bacterium]
MYIIKASGEKEKYQPQKIVRTILRAGANKNLAREVIQKIEPFVYEGMSTKEILKLVRKFLSQKEKTVAAKYNLKKAIMQLGPTGFNFEKLVERILQKEGYQTSTPLVTQGRCAQHEIDVIAKKENSIYDIECKYRNARGIYVGLQTALYVWARHQDLVGGSQNKKCPKFTQPWLWCNTRFSSQVIQYGGCAKMKLTGWDYPAKESLRDLLEKNKFYPITVLTSLSQKDKANLFKNNIILIQDLLNQDLKKIQVKTKIDLNKLKNWIDQSKKILNLK